MYSLYKRQKIVYLFNKESGPESGAVRTPLPNELCTNSAMCWTAALEQGPGLRHGLA